MIETFSLNKEKEVLCEQFGITTERAHELSKELIDYGQKKLNSDVLDWIIESDKPINEKLLLLLLTGCVMGGHVAKEYFMFNHLKAIMRGLKQ